MDPTRCCCCCCRRVLVQKSVERFLCWWEWVCCSPWAFCTGWGFGHGRLCWKDWIQRSGLWFVGHWPILGSFPFSIPSFCSPSCKFLWTVAIPNAYSDPCQNGNGGMLCLVNRSKPEYGSSYLPENAVSKSSTLYASQEALAHLIKLSCERNGFEMCNLIPELT